MTRLLTDAEIARRRAADPLGDTPLLVRLYLSYSDNCRVCELEPQPYSVFHTMLVEQLAGEQAADALGEPGGRRT